MCWRNKAWWVLSSGYHHLTGSQACLVIVSPGRISRVMILMDHIWIWGQGHPMGQTPWAKHPPSCPPAQRSNQCGKGEGGLQTSEDAPVQAVGVHSRKRLSVRVFLPPLPSAGSAHCLLVGHAFSTSGEDNTPLLSHLALDRGLLPLFLWFLTSIRCDFFL